MLVARDGRDTVDLVNSATGESLGSVPTARLAGVQDVLSSGLPHTATLAVDTEEGSPVVRVVLVEHDQL